MRGVLLLTACRITGPWPALLLAAVLSALALGAAAQPVVPPGAVVPPQGSPIPNLAPPEAPPVGPGLGNAPPVAPAPGAADSVAIRDVAVDGATAFPASRLIDLAGAVTGPAVSVAALEAARAAILSLYRTEGYVFTTVDAVVDRGGVLRFVVGEGHVTEVQLDGDIGPAGTQVLRFLNHLIGLQPLDVASLERWLLLAQDIPGVTLRGVLRPAGTAPGALTLVAQLSRRSLSGFVTADNRGFRLSGPEQALAVAQFNSFTALGERTELSFFYGFNDTQLFGQASTEFFLGGSGLRMRLYAGRGRATPSGALRAVGYEGETTVAGVALSYPLLRRRVQTLTLTGAFDLIGSEINVDNAAGRPGRLSRDDLRVVRLGADWAVYDLLAGEARPASNLLSLRLSQGIDGLGATRSGGATLGRQGAQTDFTKIVLDVTRTQALFAPWTGANLALQLTLAGQWSDSILPQAEKFYLGGARLGRGFYAGEVTGDRALAGSVELQLSPGAFDYSLFGRELHFDPLVYAFYDWGRTWENVATDPDRQLRSFGLGARVAVNARVEGQLEGVHRLTRRPSGAQTTPLEENAVFWRILVRF